MRENPESRCYELIALSDESTVVAEYVPDSVRNTNYQSEAGLDKLAAFFERYFGPA